MGARKSIIVAVSENRVIGKDNKLPWHIPEDFQWFKKHTNGHPVIMGRKTYESIGRVLPGRKNVIISRQKKYQVPEALVCDSLQAAIATLEAENVAEIFIIGGNQIFRQAIDSVDRIYLTHIHRNFRGDTYFPPIPESKFKKIFEEKHYAEIAFSFFIYDRVRS